MNIKVFWNSIDRLNFILIFILGLLGVLLSFSVNQNFLFINRHTVFFIFSMLIILFLSQQNDKNIRRLALFGFLFLIILLLSLFFLDYEVKGSKRWLGGIIGIGTILYAVGIGYSVSLGLFLVGKFYK